MKVRKKKEYSAIKWYGTNYNEIVKFLSEFNVVPELKNNRIYFHHTRTSYCAPIAGYIVNENGLLTGCSEERFNEEYLIC